MNDPKSTNDIRLIAQDVTHTQAELCKAKRENLTDKLVSLTETVTVNALAISALTSNMATWAATLPPLAKDVAGHDKDIEVLKEDVTTLKGKPTDAKWAAIGAAIPVALGVLMWWLSR